METNRTGFFEYDSMTNKERKSIILEKIEDDIKEVKELLEQPISDKEAFKLRGKQDALERLKVEINSIREDSIRLVPLTSCTLGTQQHLSTDNKFLNAAYFRAMIIRDERRERGGSTMASSTEGEIGKREAMSEIMTYIEYL